MNIDHKSKCFPRPLMLARCLVFHRNSSFTEPRCNTIPRQAKAVLKYRQQRAQTPAKSALDRLGSLSLTLWLWVSACPKRALASCLEGQQAQSPTHTYTHSFFIHQHIIPSFLHTAFVTHTLSHLHNCTQHTRDSLIKQSFPNHSIDIRKPNK